MCDLLKVMKSTKDTLLQVEVIMRQLSIDLIYAEWR